MEKPFNFLRWFSALSLLCIVLIGIVLTLVLSRLLIEHMLQREAVVSQEFIDSIVRAEQTWPYFVDPENAEAKVVLESFFNHIANLPDVFRAHVYAQDRTVIWSSVKSFVGRRLGPNPELEESFAGAVMAEISVVGSDDKAEHVEFLPEIMGLEIVEFYIPIRNSAGDSVIGVVEIYKRPLALFAAIEGGKQLLWASVAGGGLLLYLSLFWIARRASIVIREQQERLIDSETMAAVGEMAAAVAHGIRNPLTSIRSSAELALEEDLGDAHESVSDIIIESDRMDRWVRDLLLYSCESCDPHRLEKEKVDVNDLVRKNLQDFAAVMDRQKVALVIDTQEPLPLASGNASALGQVLNGIVANSLDAMPETGRLEVTTRLDAAKRSIVVKIADDGQGLSPEALKRIFRPSFTTKRHGLGLGLALARRLVARCGGSLDLASVEGQGTTVTFRLPTTRQDMG